MCLKIHSGSCLDGHQRNGNIGSILCLKVGFFFSV